MASFSCCYCCCCSQFYKTMVNVVLRILDILISWHKVWDLSFLNLPVFQVFSWTPCHLNPSIFKQASGLVLSSDHKCHTDLVFEIFAFAFVSVFVLYFYFHLYLYYISIFICISTIFLFEEMLWQTWVTALKPNIPNIPNIWKPRLLDLFDFPFEVQCFSTSAGKWHIWRSLEAKIFSSSLPLHWCPTFTITKCSKLIFASEDEHMTQKIEWQKSPFQKCITISCPTKPIVISWIKKYLNNIWENLSNIWEYLSNIWEYLSNICKIFQQHLSHIWKYQFHPHHKCIALLCPKPKAIIRRRPKRPHWCAHYTAQPQKDSKGSKPVWSPI